jgi:aminopeptidase N
MLLLLCALQGAPASASDSAARHVPLHHDVTVIVGDTGTHILGVVTTTWLLVSADPVEVPLDSSFRVVRVLTDGQGETRMGRITFALNPGGGVYIPHQRHTGDTLHTTIRYHGNVSDGLIIRTDSAGRRTVFADNWPDRERHWLPIPLDPGAKATVDLHLEVPGDMTVVANGLLTRIDTLAHGRRTWHFQMAQPIPPYGIVFGAGPLTVTPLAPAACAVKCVPLAVMSLPEDSAWAVQGPFHRAGDMLDFFSALVGPFPYQRLSHVQSSTRFGGMENPSAIFYDTKAYTSRRLSEETVAHETAHQWFGDAVTEAEWHHLWLSEGFATYYAALWLGHAEGDSAFQASMRRQAKQVFDSPASDRPILDFAATDLMGLLNSNNYPKGAWVLHSLRGLIGDSAYQQGIRAWYTTYRDSSAVSGDFATVMERVAGQDLGWYFHQALEQPGFPELEVRWTRRGGRLEMTIRQVQSAAWGTYRIPDLVVAVDGRRVSVNLAELETRVTIPGVSRDPTQVVVDPDGWWLLRTRSVGKAGS